ncbi:chemotaxis-specific protein-glutamate methyltransferase CheB [Rhodopseudomonas sp. P2A-2r]|uniref:chemotaxis-specific protein-glutamate methyltransferase CheB n=1 Tax=unclassified Rhodopseudomonas TaxID=2638247 RepID=UPI0022343C44|nr:chemotaxis-specific protein-glutamate methyltransferase CheB [Rhodopseudomonas sp. P2A-2r]UZE49018.1 chemotaxis-specific protein-glutamate methyltransferase CheB [Rhodopseudomonas sp. P2A-2r]
MLKLLIADDSALMRKCLGDIFKAEGDFEVSFARNGAEALSMARSIAPDVITLDVNMPEMDGITCLSRIMVECPKPVVMVSSITGEGAEVTLQALSLGAVDFIPKPDGTVSLHIDKIRVALVAKVRSAARARISKSRGLLDRVRHRAQSVEDARRSASSARTGGSGTAKGVVLIGVSTGGPGAIETVLPRLPGNFPWPILIAQHMPESFTGVFARRINSLSELEVVEVTRPMPLRGGVAYVGRGDADFLVVVRAGVLAAIPVPASPLHNWHPSVERLVESALEHVTPEHLLGVMLTGMGDDGARAMAELKSRGGRTIAESEDTAVVWGMPGELVKRGGATIVLPIERVADQLRRWTN